MQNRKSALLLRAVCVATLLGSVVAIVYAQGRNSLSETEARRLIARVAGIDLNRSAVQVKEIQTLGSSATAVAGVETAFRFNREAGKWRVAEIRVGSGRWEDVDLILRAVNAEKRARAAAELETLATGLEAFRRERGFYVVAAKDDRALADHLSPRYVKEVIRFDPWHRPYVYEGTAVSYRLRSSGADGIADTPDDVIRDNN
ncbi:MAG: type II secretion system protein GspG [Pyrinomonadaceae bacterium]|nr:type II secretion system protein GspG [Pyrinomonadaceae bacterium]